MAQILDTFFCFSLHTGTVILGWFGFCSAFLSIIGWSTYIGHVDQFINATFNVSSTMSEADIEFLREISVTTIAIMIGLAAIECLASLFIIYGASQNKRLFLVPWMLERATQIAYLIVMMIIMTFFFFSNPETLGLSLFVLIFGGFVFAFQMYCFLCVYSLYHMLKDMEMTQPLLGPGLSNPNYAGTTYVKIA